MRIFKPSTLFTDEIAFGRYCAHPLTSLSHLGLACAIFACMASRPAPEFSPWLWVAALVCPGAWIITAGSIYMMMVTAKLLGGRASLVLLGDENAWSSVLLRREGLAALLFISLIPVTISWYDARPFGDDDFHRCVRQLGEPGMKSLSGSVQGAMSRNEFWVACRRVAGEVRPLRVFAGLPVSKGAVAAKLKEV